MRTSLFAFGFVVSLACPACAEDLRISTGSSTGTYIQIGQQIADVAKKSAGLEVAISTSQGSVENIKRLLGYDLGPNPETPQYFQLAIIQDDVLADLKRHAAGSALLSEIVDKVKIVLPLYDEEIHLFVRAGGGVNEIGDLADAAIAAGKPSSGSYVTTSLLLALADVNVSADQLNPNGGKDALDMLSQQAIDVVVQVAGAPSKLGNGLSPDSGFSLAAITTPSVFEGDSPYRSKVISPDIYPWLTVPVETAAVGSVLVAYDYAADNPNCEKITKVTKAILTSLEDLKKTGHPKWREVRPNDALARGGAMSDCARRAFE